MADTQDPYIKKNPGDLIRSKDWNDLQVTLRSTLVTVEGKVEANTAALASLQTTVAAVEASSSTIVAISAYAGPSQPFSLAGAASFDIANLRFGITVDVQGLPELDALSLARSVSVELLLPFPLGSSSPSDAPLSLGMQWLSLRGSVQRVDTDTLLWVPVAADLYRLAEATFASLIKNPIPTVLEARLIVDGDFVGSTSAVPGQLAPRLVGGQQLAGGRFELRFCVHVPLQQVGSGYTMVPYWPWIYATSVGNFYGAPSSYMLGLQGIGGGLL